jgi:hypothetical protein
MNLLEGMRSDCGEGNISWFENRQQKLIELISEIKPEKIMEIGFNMGHSALLICQTIINLKSIDPSYKTKKIEFYIFDICQHECVKSNLSILEKEFGNEIVFKLFEGDSLITLNSFFDRNKVNFDFIEIDGCHTYECVRSDTFNTIKNLSGEGVIYIDDYKSEVFPIIEVDRGVDSMDWSDFDTNYIDGVFWGKKKYKTEKYEPILEDNNEIFNNSKFLNFLELTNNLLREDDLDILYINIDHLKRVTNLMIEKIK